MGAYLTEQLLAMRADVPLIAGVRGKGLLLGLELSEAKGGPFEAACRERGLIVNKLQDQLIRLAPPLVLTEAEADEALGIMKAAMGAEQSLRQALRPGGDRIETRRPAGPDRQAAESDPARSRHTGA